MEIFELAFMQRALLASLLVGIAAPLVGVFIVQRRLALLGDGLGHVALAGVAAGMLTQSSPVWVALAACVAAAVIIEILRSSAATSADVAVAMMFYGGIALGVLLMSRVKTSGGPGLMAYLFGSIVTTTQADVVAFGALTAVIVLLIALFGSRIYSVGNDEEFAVAMGMPVRALNIMLATLTAATVVLSMRVIGLLLISALMVLPVAVAQRIAGSVAATLVWSISTGLVMSVGGVVLAYHLDTPSGATVVLLGIAAFIVVSVVAAGVTTVRRRGAHPVSHSVRS